MFKLGIKVMKLVESLIGWEVTVGQGSECHLTFVRGRLYIAEYDPIIDHKMFKSDDVLINIKDWNASRILCIFYVFI